MFATGIENSSPVITGKDGRDLRRDEMESCRHYEDWRADFDLVKSLGIRYLRYGVPCYRVHVAPDKFDWEFSDQAFGRLREMRITPIADLCHFGVPDWVGGFQNTEWPEMLARYAARFAERYPWIRLYTPVNEIRVCATFSALQGKWNERLKSEVALVNAIRNMSRATVLAEEAILRITPGAKFIQSEATTHFHATIPAAENESARLNQLRFLALDLCYGRDVSATTFEYLLDRGFTRTDYDWFREHGRALNPSCIMGNDYYASNEHIVNRDGKVAESNEIYGYYILTKEYYTRYRLPIMYTETNNLSGKDAVNWLRKEWANALRLKRDSVPLVGFTWYSLTDQIDWDTGLAEDNGRVTPVGLCDLDRKVKPVGERYRELIDDWRQETERWPAYAS